MDRKGLFYGVFAYLLWGFFPIYWKLIKSVDADEILLHRIIWSFIFLIILLTFKRSWAWIKQLISSRKMILAIIAAASLLGVNWFIYIWGVNSGHIVETSLGYFINPLVNVLLGVFFLQESLRTGQWLAVALAALGVAYLTITASSFPWIALSLAFTFGFYGLIKKKSRLGAAESLTAEMGFLFLPAVMFLIYLEYVGQAKFGHSNPLIFILLLGSGAVTAIPLVFFAAAARRIQLSTMGFLQYIAPTIQFFIGVYIFNEAFTSTRLIGFTIIWIALAIYSLESVVHQRTSISLANSKV